MNSCYHSLAPISAHGLIQMWYFRCYRMGTIYVITYKYVIIIFTLETSNYLVEILLNSVYLRRRKCIGYQYRCWWRKPEYPGNTTDLSHFQLLTIQDDVIRYIFIIFLSEILDILQCGVFYNMLCVIFKISALTKNIYVL